MEVVGRVGKVEVVGRVGKVGKVEVVGRVGRVGKVLVDLYGICSARKDQ